MSLGRLGLGLLLVFAACGGRGGVRPGGASGSGSGGSGGAGGGGGILDPGGTAAWAWERCGTLSATPPFDGTLRFIADGRVLAQNKDGAALLYAARSNAVPTPLAVTGTALAFSPEGTLVAESTGASLAVRRVQDGTVVHEVAVPAGDATMCNEPVALAASGTRLLARGAAGQCLYDLAAGRVIARLPVANGGGAFRADSDELVAVVAAPPGFGITVARIDGAGTELGRTVIARSADFWISPDGAAALSVTGFVDGVRECALWDTRDGAPLWSARAGVDASGLEGDVAFSPRGDLVALCGVVVRTDGVPVRDLIARPEENGRRWPQVWTSLSPDGRQLVGHEGQSGAALLDLESGRTLHLGGPTRGGPFKSLSVSRDAKLLATNGGHEVLVWNIAPRFEDSTAMWIEAVSPDAYPRIELSPDGRTLAACGDGCWLYDLATGRGTSRATATGPGDGGGTGGGVNGYCWPDLRFSPDGRWLAGAEWDPVVRVRELSREQTVRAQMQAGCVRVAFSPDSRLLATTRASVYRVEDGRPLVAGAAGIPGTLGASRAGWSDSVEFLPDQSQFLISTDCLDDEWPSVSSGLGRGGLAPVCTRVELHDASDGRRLAALPNIGRYPSFSPDGSWLVADGLLIHLPSGTTRALDVGLQASAFTSDGNIIAGDVDGNLHRYCRR